MQDLIVELGNKTNPQQKPRKHPDELHLWYGVTTAGIKRPLQDCGVAEFLMDDGFATEFTSVLMKDDDVVARINSIVPLRRWGRPHDLAGGLCSLRQTQHLTSPHSS